jgi:hypothetical protein
MKQQNQRMAYVQTDGQTKEYKVVIFVDCWRHKGM